MAEIEKSNYLQAGVNRELADRFVDRIGKMARSTLNPKVKAAIGGYASLYALDAKNWLAASTDGVGTKLKLAFASGDHSTVGIDLVAMSVNDLLCVGAKPLFFLDYFATGRLEPEIAEQVLSGIIAGCAQAQCPLVGGETAEMPDFYQPCEYDLAGFAVGSVPRQAVLPRKDVKKGDVLLGVASSGFHSNGYSLLRKLLAGVESDRKRHQELTRQLLTPTRIYARAVAPLFGTGSLKGLAHITGSGFLNVPRISDRVSYEIELPARHELPAVFEWVRQSAGMPLAELAQTFNMGIGLVLVVSPRAASAIRKKLEKSGEKTWEIGKIVAKRPGRGSEVFVRDPGADSVVLSY